MLLIMMHDLGFVRSLIHANRHFSNRPKPHYTKSVKRFEIGGVNCSELQIIFCVIWGWGGGAHKQKILTLDVAKLK